MDERSDIPDAPSFADRALNSDELSAEISDAFASLRSGFERLLSIGDRGDLCALGPDRLIELAQHLETHRSRLGALDTLVVEAATEERLDQHLGSRTLAMGLAEVLRISKTTARARVARAEQTRALDSFSTAASAEHPILGEAIRYGRVTDDQVGVIGPALRRLRTNPQVGSDDLRQAEQALIDHADALGPEALRVVAAKIDDVLLPDGVQPRDEVAQARRGITLGGKRSDGTHSIKGSLTTACYTQLRSVLDPLAAPRPADDVAGPDPRTAAQRTHDALQDSMSRLLDSPGLPRSGGTPATVHLTIDIDQLRAALATFQQQQNYGSATREPLSDSAQLDDVQWPGRPRRGVRLGTDRRERAWAPTRTVAATAFGDQITFSEVVQLAEQARIIPTYLSATNGIVGYGAQRRCATEGQTHALIARDHGCSFPGCDAPPQWCERHHVIEWYRGGPTDLNNLVLLCGYHHREFATRGWQVVIYHGLPVWIPPPRIDREQRPLINVRIRPPVNVLDPGAAGGNTGKFEHLDAAAVLAYGAATERAILAGAARNNGPGKRVDPGNHQRWKHAAEVQEDLDELDPIESLIDLLAQHVTAEEREEFHYDIDLVMDSYLGPNAPIHQPHLEPVA